MPVGSVFMSLARVRPLVQALLAAWDAPAAAVLADACEEEGLPA